MLDRWYKTTLYKTEVVAFDLMIKILEDRMVGLEELADRIKKNTTICSREKYWNFYNIKVTNICPIISGIFIQGEKFCYNVLVIYQQTVTLSSS